MSRKHAKFLWLLPGIFLCCPTWAGGGWNWQTNNAGRSAPLPVPSTGQAGFTLLTPDQTVLVFTNSLSDELASENQIRLNGSGVAAGDVDGDGWCDLYLCGLESGNKLYRNLGDWKFADITQRAGVGCTNQSSTGSVLADIDGDNDLDLLVAGIGVGARCFTNDGSGRFTEGARSGLIRRFGSTSITLADIDGDGDLDVYVANYRASTIRTTGFAVLNMGGKRMIRPEDRNHLAYTDDGRVLEFGEPDLLYRNEGGARFTPLQWTNGAFLDEDGKALAKPPLDWGLSAMFRDLNGDRFPDLYVCNDFHTMDKIWLNDGHGRFRAIPRLALRQISTFSMCVDVGDLDRDGDDDIFVADMLSRDRRRRLMQWAATEPYPPTVGVGEDRLQVDRNTLLLNRGDGTYADVGQYAGIDASDWTWSAILLDVDLDGYEDLLCATGHMFDTQDLDAEAQIQAKGPWRRDQIPKKLLMFPRMQHAKIAFRNRGDLTFEPASSGWGFDQVGVGHGMALADLDNDGDLDVIVNNLNAAAGVYRNESNAPRLAVRLKGAGANTRGIGAKIRVFGGPVGQSQEMICGGRYLSGDDSMRVFATGSATNKLTLEITWPSGKLSRIENALANRLYEIEEAGSHLESMEPQVVGTATHPWFDDVSSLINPSHQEELFADFERQPLLPNKLSQLGPGVGWIDVDGDGWEDLLVGSGKGGQLCAFRNEGNGMFKRVHEPPFAQTATRDQTGILGWRKSNGQVVVLVGSANYEDGLAAGSCVRQYDRAAKKIDDSFPGHPSSTGPLALADMDGDGSLELFVGGRVVSARFPEPASSLLFRNRGGRWVLDDANTRILQKVGLVSGAVWTDLDGDHLPELVLTCEWGPVRVFKPEEGKFRDVTAQWGLERLRGCWTGVSAGDFNGDGRMDLLAANRGLNGPDRASADSPLRLYYGDFDGNGTVDLIEAHLDSKRQWMPSRDLNSMLAGMPFLAHKFPTHAAYSEATVAEICTDRMAPSTFLEVTTLSSTVFLNRGDDFEAVPLPREAQFAPAFGVAIADFDGDGREDVFLSQNFFGTRPQVPRYDAGRGLLLKGDGAGGFLSMPGQETGLKANGEQRGSAVGDYDHDGRPDLVVTQNGAQTKLFRNRIAKPGIRVRLVGPAGNPDGVGVRMRLQFGERFGPAREVHAGSGYWSQDAPVVVLATPEAPTQLEVIWPGGKEMKVKVPPGAQEIEVTLDGKVTSSAN